jgi:hypothetical protein
MNTTENNKLIAEFLHGKNANHPNQYHENWNEIMQVVEKIESLAYDVQIILDYCIITNGDYSQTTQLGGAKIHSVYNACVEFIKWYNQQTK